MAYLNSVNIKVYPSGYRKKDINFESSVNSEENLNEIASRLVANKSYIVDEDISGNISFVIDGYLFSTTKSSIVDEFSSVDEGTSIYAHIKTKLVQTTVQSVTSTFKTLIPYTSDEIGILDSIDSTPKFLGVSFDNTEGDDDYALKLYTRTSSSYSDARDWTLEEHSKLVFNVYQIQNGDSLKSIDEELTTEKVTADHVIDKDLVKDYAITVNSNKRLVSQDMTHTAGSVDGQTATFTYVDTVSQNTVGWVSVTQNSKTVSTGDGQGQLKIGNENVSVKELTTSGQPTFANITDTGLKTDQSATADTHKSVVRDGSGKLQSVSLVVNSPSVPSSGTVTSLEFIDQVAQNSFGQISATKKKITLETGDSQGALKVNGSNYTVNNLTASGTPTFANVKLTDNKLKTSGNYDLTFPSAGGKLATITWNSSTNTLTIKTS